MRSENEDGLNEDAALRTGIQQEESRAVRLTLFLSSFRPWPAQSSYPSVIVSDEVERGVELDLEASREVNLP